MNIIAYCDGSASKNGSKDAKTGIGVFYPDFPKLNLSEPCDVDGDKRTNIRAELTAIIRCIENILDNFEIPDILSVIIVTDSLFCIKAVTEWSKSWRKNNWIKSDKTPVENPDLIKKLIYLVEEKDINIVFKHVRGHKKEPSDKETEDWRHWHGNNQSDILAKGGSKKESK
jgi:ribonuclease HI